MSLFYSRKPTFWARAFYLLLVLLVLAVLITPRELFAAGISTPPTPTLIWPENQDQTILGKPVIRGLTKNDTSVEVFIDGKLNGTAKVKNGGQGTASFSYQPFLSLKPGSHTISVRAWNSDAQAKSELSQLRTFVVEEPYPAPILYQPVVNEKTVSTKPFIVGVALNNSLIKVFIDGKLNGQFQLKNGRAKTASFSYQPFLDLDPNQGHLVYATASDSNGKESVYSNVIGFLVRAPQIAAAENPQVLGVADVIEATTDEALEKEETTEEIKEPVEGETTTEEELEEEADTEEETEDRNSTLIWWVILIIVIIIIAVNLRGRGKKDGSGGLKGLAELGKKEDQPSEKPDSESKGKQQTLLEKNESKNKEGGEKNMPPPPPSK